MSVNEYKKGRQTTKDLIEGTTMCTDAEWDARLTELNKTRVGLKRSCYKALQKRGRMSTLRLPDGAEPMGRRKNDALRMGY